MSQFSSEYPQSLKKSNMPINPIRLLLKAFAVCVFLVSGKATADALFAETEQEEKSQSDVSLELSLLRQRLESVEKSVASTRQQINVFNPAMTVFGNVMGCAVWPSKEDHDDKQAGHAGHSHNHHGHSHAKKHDDHEHGHAEEGECFNSLWLREVEFDLRASIDPYADGVLIFAFHQESPGAFELEVEEAYAVLKPGFQLKLGRFLSFFGRINRIHPHDLPWMTAPLSVKHFLGDHGMIREGASAEFQIPTPGKSNALTMNLEVLFGGNTPLAETENNIPKTMGRLSWFFDLSNGHDLDLGASALIQPSNKGGSVYQLYGADFNYKWRPHLMGDYKSFLLGGEMFLVAGANQTYYDRTPVGGFLWTQFQFNQNAYLGLRYSYDQGATTSAALNTSAGVFFTYYTTEFLRFRAGYDRISNHADFSEGRNHFMFELNFIFGSHPAEPYWVNR